MVASLERAADAFKLCDDSLPCSSTQRRGIEALRFDELEQARQTFQVVECALDRRYGLVNRLPQEIPDRRLDQDDREQRKQQAPDRPNRDGADRDPGDQRRRPAQPPALESIRRPRPLIERLGMQIYFQRFAVDRHGFAELQTGAQIGNAGVAGLYLLQVRRARSHCARMLSPNWVRAAHKSSYKLSVPNRSKSSP